jgi:glyoxylase-like metal-dependent hydrolase (beta-lactamase superfamily II)
MRELAPGILVWSRFSPPHGYDFNGTLVLDRGGNLCIDPVEPSHEEMERLVAEGVERILLTNRNHGRFANRVRERTGAPVEIHACDADHARTQGIGIDATLEVTQRVGPFTVVAVPGKSRGEIALHDAARRLLIVGDALIGHPAGRLTLLPDKVVDDPAQLRASVRRLLELDFDTLVVGDGVSIPSGAHAALEDLVRTLPPEPGGGRPRLS